MGDSGGGGGGGGGSSRVVNGCGVALENFSIFDPATHRQYH